MYAHNNQVNNMNEFISMCASFLYALHLVYKAFINQLLLHTYTVYSDQY